MKTSDGIFQMHIKVDEGTFRIFSFFGVHVRQYAPAFATRIPPTNVLITKLHDIPDETVDIFSGWLCACSYQERGSGEATLPWELLTPTSKYDMSGDPIVWQDSTAQDRVIAAANFYIFAKAYDIPRLRQDTLDRLVTEVCIRAHIDTLPSDLCCARRWSTATTRRK
jgi:hypothetical protein